ncbi:hypothetical protein [Paraburkholderia elongata]|uniref:Uncharacterized protein n=1 Tax=Paraburkholderia elongata TaxID=2675747 RepID=A0A972SQD6_9BURK|nr:hypothetical protein [Paraburkholderia elongata]NPT59685.1 hypothetical protein [Paraburkholderia elongata]
MSILSQLGGAAIDTLVALVENGPLWDGDVPSKSGRDTLVVAGLASCIVVKGEDGYQAATLAGAAAYREHFGNAAYIREATAFRKAKNAISSARHQSKG